MLYRCTIDANFNKIVILKSFLYTKQLLSVLKIITAFTILSTN